MKWYFIIFFFSIFSLSCLQSNVDHWEIATPSFQSWKYVIETDEIDVNWKKLSYDDSSWIEGIEGIKQLNDSIIATLNKSLFLRINFSIYDIRKIEQALLQTDYNVAFVAYINDTEVARRDIGVIIDKSIKTDNKINIYNYWSPKYFFINKKTLSNCLNQGNNVLAIKILNRKFTSINFSKISLLLGINDKTNIYNNPAPSFSPKATFSSSNLPVIIINTNEQAIIDDPRIIADMGIIYNGKGKRNYITDSFNNYNGKISIEIRGFVSQAFRKKSYGLETKDSKGNKINVTLLNMPKENDWVLYAPYADMSLMRNVLAYKIANDLGHYAPKTQFCELIINDCYQGIYVLTEKIKRDIYRVNISKLTINDTFGDNLTGGYIIKTDRPDKDFWKSPYPDDTSIAINAVFEFCYPKPEDILDVQKDYIKNYITEFEAALYNTDFNDSIDYRTYIDINSFIDYLIINELTKNIDAYRLSTYMYKDRDSKAGRLTMGPVWDLNFTFGLPDYLDGYKTDGWVYNSMKYIPFWWNKLLQDTESQGKLVQRWAELRNGPLHTESIIEYVDSVAFFLRKGQERNFVKWPILGTEEMWPNYFIGETYQEEVNYLKQWIADRLIWLDENIPALCNVINNE